MLWASILQAGVFGKRQSDVEPQAGFAHAGVATVEPLPVVNVTKASQPLPDTTRQPLPLERWLKPAKNQYHTALAILEEVEPVTPETLCIDVLQRFDAQPDLHFLPVVTATGQVEGLLSRIRLITHFSHRFSHDLHARKSCAMFVDREALVVAHDMPIPQLGQLFSRVSRRSINHGFIIVDGERYLGVGYAADLMAYLTEMQMSAARYANPLTQLPGNVVIDEEIDRLIYENTPFVAVYFDLNHFKPFNDAYGYSLGDELIRMLGVTLVDSVDKDRDFVGHIGGDDFFVLFRSEDWEVRCARVLAAFDWRLRSSLRQEDLDRGGYYSEDRRGEVVFQPLPSLAAGAVHVGAGGFNSHHEVAAAASVAKKHAKKHAGSYLFVERRRT